MLYNNGSGKTTSNDSYVTLGSLKACIDSDTTPQVIGTDAGTYYIVWFKKDGTTSTSVEKRVITGSTTLVNNSSSIGIVFKMS